MSTYTIKESPGEAFFIKNNNQTIAAFRKKEHAEFFVDLINGMNILKKLMAEKSSYIDGWRIDPQRFKNLTVSVIEYQDVVKIFDKCLKHGMD